MMFIEIKGDKKSWIRTIWTWEFGGFLRNETIGTWEWSLSKSQWSGPSRGILSSWETCKSEYHVILDYLGLGYMMSFPCTMIIHSITMHKMQSIGMHWMHRNVHYSITIDHHCISQHYVDPCIKLHEIPETKRNWTASYLHAAQV